MAMRYGPATYDDGSQAIMYDVPTSASYGKVRQLALLVGAMEVKITGDGYSISIIENMYGHVMTCASCL